MKFFESIEIGDRREVGSHTFTAEDIKRFAARFDPQLFHLDEEAARRSHFGALCASGWHTAAVHMRLLVLHHQRMQAEMRARGEPIAKWGPSPGFKNLKWVRPVYAGDTITFAGEVIDKRTSASRPGWGIIIGRTTGTNQKDELVFEFQSAGFVQMRGGASD
jgi:acyl dehydratase